jgi:hypothetical protein
LTAAGNDLFFAPEGVQNRQFVLGSDGSTLGVLSAVRENEHNRDKSEARMVAELNLLDIWIPEQMEPGTLFMLDQPGELGKVDNPFWAVLACPACGSLGLITRQQCSGMESMICGSDDCSSEYYLDGGTIRYRAPS